MQNPKLGFGGSYNVIRRTLGYEGPLHRLPFVCDESAIQEEFRLRSTLFVVEVKQIEANFLFLYVREFTVRQSLLIHPISLSARLGRGIA
jgi:hypothetical protein